MPKITLGPSYFCKERDAAYSRWGTAFWRENFQNSIDAGASRINVQLLNPATNEPTLECDREKPNRILVRFIDNGCGMSRETLENVFFRLGETTKGDSTTVGGFGRARLMTHFSANRYSINTGPLLVEGAGEDYEIKDTATGYHRGCDMFFDLNAIDKYGDNIDMYRSLTNYLTRCQLDCDVYINNERWKTWAYRRSITRSLSFGSLHVNKSAVEKDCDGVLVVRVSGVKMYERSICPSVQIILEIDPTRSRDVLYSNRDGLNWRFSDELDRYINLLSSETKSALEEQGNIVTTVKGSGHFVHYRHNAAATLTNRPNPAVAASHSVMPTGRNVNYEIDRTIAPESHDTGYDRAAPAPVKPLEPPKSVSFIDGLVDDSVPDEIDGDDEVNEDLGVEEASNDAGNEVVDLPIPVRKTITPEEKAIRLTEEQRRRLFDLLINNNTVTLEDEDDRKAVRKVIASYNPENWKVIHRPVQGFTFTGGLKAKVLLVWKAICHYVVLEALEQFGQEKYEWGCGWYFGRHGAEHHQIGEVRYLLLNPVDNAGKLKYQLTDRKHWDSLVALAIHEVCHFAVSPHNEDWATAVTDLTARVLGRMPKIIREIKRVKKIKMV